MLDLRRRQFITLLGGALADLAMPANAQDPVRVRTVAALMGFANDAGAKARIEVFEKSLEGEGWSLGQNLRVSTAMPKATPRACRRSRKNWRSSSRTAFSPRAPRS